MLNETTKLRNKLLTDKSIKLSCIIPTHNESETIIDFLNTLAQKISTYTENFELIVVDDGSTDDTVELLFKNNISKTKLIKLSRNFGKETALTAGLEYASGDATILIDADFQHPIDTIDEFIRLWSNGYDMVYGVRKNRNDESRLKRKLTQSFYKIMQKITNINIIPNAGDFRLLDKKVVNSLNSCHERARFMKGLYAWVGFKSTGVIFEVVERKAGTSSWSFGKLTELAITGITSFSNIPLRVWSFIGFIISAMSFGYACYQITVTMIYGVDVPGYSSLMVAIMFFGGVQLMSIGILGEYIARIFNEVKQRPKYIIESTFEFN